MRELEVLETLVRDRNVLGAWLCAGLAATVLAVQPLSHAERRLRALVTGALRLDQVPLALALDREGRLFRVCRSLAELEAAHVDALHDPALNGSSGTSSVGAPLR